MSRSAAASDYAGGKRVLLAKPRGYCAGVDRAVQTVERALDHYGSPVYVRKQIVHNLHVVQSLEARGAIFVEENDEVPEGSIVVFSAHGVAPEVHEQARERNLKAIDATCPLVTKVHQEARRFAADDFDILLIGHEGHEEVVGTSGEAPEHITIVDGPVDVEQVEVRDPAEGGLAVADHAVGRRDDADRRRAARAVPAAAVTAVGRHLLRHPEPPGRGEADRPGRRAVPGGRVGELVELGADGGGRCRRGRGCRAPGRERRPRSTSRGCDGVTSVGLSSGASVPEILVHEVTDWLAERGYADLHEVSHTEERLTFALPQELRRDLRTAARPSVRPSSGRRSSGCRR